MAYKEVSRATFGHILIYPSFPIDWLFVIVNKNLNFAYCIAFVFYIYTDCFQNMREDDHNIILVRKHREVQRYSFQNISTQVNKFQPKQYIPMCKGFPH
jgi:hypothetical protein